MDVKFDNSSFISLHQIISIISLGHEFCLCGFTVFDHRLGETSRHDQLDGGLDLRGRQGRLAGLASLLGSLVADLLEDIVDKRVEGEHRLLRSSGLRQVLLQNTVDGGLEGVPVDNSLGLLGQLASDGRLLYPGFGRHFLM